MSASRADERSTNGWGSPQAPSESAAPTPNSVEEELSRFRAILDHSGEAIFITDAHTSRFVDVNDTACRWVGVSRERLLQMRVSDLDLGFPLESSDEDLNHVTDTRDSNRPIAFVRGSHRRRNGTSFPVEVALSRRRFGGRDFLLAVARDANQRLHSNQSYLEGEYERAGLFAISRDAGYCSARDGTVSEVNDSALDLFGYTRNEFLGLDARILYRNPEHIRAFQRAIEEDGSVKNFPAEFQTKAGQSFRGFLGATLRYDADGYIQGYQCFISPDIETAALGALDGEADRLERELEEAKAEAEAARADVEQAVSHAAEAKLAVEEATKRADALERETERAKEEAEAARSETAQTELKAEQATERATLAEAEAESTKSEIENAILEVAIAKLKAVQARERSDALEKEAEQSRDRADALEREAERAKREIEETRSELAKAQMDADEARERMQQLERDAESAMPETQRAAIEAASAWAKLEQAEQAVSVEIVDTPPKVGGGMQLLVAPDGIHRQMKTPELWPKRRRWPAVLFAVAVVAIAASVAGVLVMSSVDDRTWSGAAIVGDSLESGPREDRSTEDSLSLVAPASEGVADSQVEFSADSVTQE